MASIKTKFAVGLFVAMGIGLGIVAIVWLGMSNYLEKGHLFAAYFDESVQGLSKDSPVKYRGVSIGRVERIGVAPDGNLIEVIVKIETGLQVEKQAIADVVAQMKTVGITGIMFIELERKKPGDPDGAPRLNFESEYPVIATKPSDISKIIRGVEDVLKQLRELDMVGITDRIKSTLDVVQHAVEDAHIREISGRVRDILAKTDKLFEGQNGTEIADRLGSAAQKLNILLNQASATLRRIETLISSSEPEVRKALADFSAAMKNAQGFMEKGKALMTGSEKDLANLQRHLTVLFQNLEKATSNLNRFVESIADRPSELIFSRPPQEPRFNRDRFD